MRGKRQQDFHSTCLVADFATSASRCCQDCSKPLSNLRVRVHRGHACTTHAVMAASAQHTVLHFCVAQSRMLPCPLLTLHTHCHALNAQLDPWPAPPHPYSIITALASCRRSTTSLHYLPHNALPPSPFGLLRCLAATGE